MAKTSNFSARVKKIGTQWNPSDTPASPELLRAAREGWYQSYGLDKIKPAVTQSGLQQDNSPSGLSTKFLVPTPPISIDSANIASAPKIVKTSREVDSVSTRDVREPYAVFADFCADQAERQNIMSYYGSFKKMSSDCIRGALQNPELATSFQKPGFAERFPQQLVFAVEQYAVQNNVQIPSTAFHRYDFMLDTKAETMGLKHRVRNALIDYAVGCAKMYRLTPAQPPKPVVDSSPAAVIALAEMTASKPSESKLTLASSDMSEPAPSSIGSGIIETEITFPTPSAEGAKPGILNNSALLSASKPYEAFSDLCVEQIHVQKVMGLYGSLRKKFIDCARKALGSSEVADHFTDVDFSTKFPQLLADAMEKHALDNNKMVSGTPYHRYDFLLDSKTEKPGLKTDVRTAITDYATQCARLHCSFVEKHEPVISSTPSTVISSAELAAPQLTLDIPLAKRAWLQEAQRQFAQLTPELKLEAIAILANAPNRAATMNGTHEVSDSHSWSARFSNINGSGQTNHEKF